ncbi:MAG: NtaA/DmoA family FMN-dependent monooxygenase [Nocardioides sp.]|uniref:NtaA/DmoA family FMN-dependent monooxygenase n=1 Tax=Nocardioides sp. TaxID=35761 RepID=UPI0039E68F11
MALPRMRLCWFINYLVPGWNVPWSGNTGADWMNGDFFVDMARSLDRAGFDAMMLEDGVHLSDAYGGDFQATLKHTVAGPKQDPLPLIPVLAAATKRLGFIATMNSTFYQPFLLARLVTTLDHLTGGRVGWNVVTGTSDQAAQNFGMDQLPDHDERYLIAEEMVEVVKKLWSSWDRDAVVLDRVNGVFVDHTRVHPIDHHGRFFDVRGPLNALPPIQDLPPIFQAGGSPTGREFAARSADVIVSSAKGIAEMKDYRREIRRRAELNRRDPDEVKILFMISPFLEETDAVARRRRAERRAVTDHHAERRLLMMSDSVDFKHFPLDRPFPDHVDSTNGSQSILESFRKWAGDLPLREAACRDEFEALPLAGTPATVADQMQHAYEEVGGDGFLIFAGGGGMITRRYIDQVCEGLVPELRRRGLVWDRVPDLPLNQRLRIDDVA